MKRCSPTALFHVDQDFILSFELVDLGANRLMPMIHFEVRRFNRSIWGRMKEVVTRLRPDFPEIIYCQPTNDTPLFEKFVSRFGFTPHGDGYCSDGKNRRIFVNYYRD